MNSLAFCPCGEGLFDFYFYNVVNMMRAVILSFFLLSILSCVNKRNQVLESALHKIVEKKLAELIEHLNELENSASQEELILKFKVSRKKYKEIEAFVEYYFQGLSRRINGPALAEIKTDDNVVQEAAGFQVIEEIIFGNRVDLAALRKQIRVLKADLQFINKNFKDLPIQPHHFYELVQHQIIRIAALGVTGFDSPIAFNSCTEAGYALAGLEEFYLQYCETNSKELNSGLLDLFRRAQQYLEKNPDFIGLNRLEFIKKHLMPLSISLEVEFKNVMEKAAPFPSNKVFYGHLADLMVGKKLNPDAFSPFAESGSTPEKVAMGKILFNDVRLSQNNKMSCATCHNAEKAFTDGKETSVFNIHRNTTQRNSPTLLYAAFQKAFFYDMRSEDLENQIESVMRNPDEFNILPKEVTEKIASSKDLIPLFAKAYPEKKKITAYEMRNAIASYVRSLMPFKSKIDQYFAGEATLSESEMNGFNLFSGKARCATCHFIPLYNGTVPPWFNNSESEVIGVPEVKRWNHATVDSDEGRYAFHPVTELKYSFKTPTVRNVEKTAPYMHNGVYGTLDEVVRFYELGGGNGIGMDLAHQTLPFDSLKLSESEKKDIISFLKSLTDETK